jgi:hypothetical protein
MAADLTGTAVTVNILLSGGETATGMVPGEVSDKVRARLLDPAIMGPPIVWLASTDAADATASGSSQQSSTTGWRGAHDDDHSPLPARSSALSRKRRGSDPEQLSRIPVGGYHGTPA